MKVIAIGLHCLDMRDFHSTLRDTPFLDGLRKRSIFLPMARGQGHHQGDSLNAEITGRWTASFCDSKLEDTGYKGPTMSRLPKTLMEYLGENGHEILTCMGLGHGYGSWAVQGGMNDIWLKDEPHRLKQFNSPAEMRMDEWLDAIQGPSDFYAHIFVRDTHRPWGQEKELFSLTGPKAAWGRFIRRRKGQPSSWPYDAYAARRLALENPSGFAALRRAGLARADREVAKIFEATKNLDDVIYLVYSNHGEVFDHFRYILPHTTSTVSGLPMVEGVSHGNFPYEALYSNMQMWVIPGEEPRVMRGMGRSIDITPTILDLASVSHDTMHGESMVPHFSSGLFPARDRYAETPLSGGCLSMVRADGFKLVSMGTDGNVEDTDLALRGFGDHALAVFDLHTDPREYVNLLDTPQGKEVLQWAQARHREISLSPAPGPPESAP